MLVYHGSNRELGELSAGSWVTADVDIAWEFALEKSAEMDGVAVVMALEVDDGDIDWDVLSMAAGIEDRGVLTRSLPAIVLPCGHGQSLASPATA